MLQPPKLPIRQGLHNHLQRLQEKIDQCSSYKEQVLLANQLWQQKKKTGAQKAAFQRIEKALQQLAIGSQHYCNYCEHTPGTSIEHIFPKSFYPQKTFLWENFLWTCTACNQQAKTAQFRLFTSPDDTQTLELKQDGQFVPPPNEDAVLIHPRLENPRDYLQLDLTTGLFHSRNTDPTSRAYLRAQYTIELLQLNSRKALVKGRQAALKQYTQFLSLYLAVLEAQQVEELPTLPPLIQAHIIRRPKLNLNQQKTQYALAIQACLMQYIHPTVWCAMQEQAPNHPSLKHYFEQLPIVYTW